MGENDGTRGTLNILNLSSSNGASCEIMSEFAPSILKSGLFFPHGHIESIPKASCLINLISLFFSPTPSRRVESYIIILIQWFMHYLQSVSCFTYSTSFLWLRTLGSTIDVGPCWPMQCATSHTLSLAKNGFIRLCAKLQCSNSIAQVSQSRCQNRTPLKWTSFSGSLGTSCSPNEAWQGHWYPKSSQICLNSLRPHGFHLGRRPPNSQQRCARSMSEDTSR